MTPTNPRTSKPVNPPSLAKPAGYSHGILSLNGERLLFLGGQVGWDTSGRIVSERFPLQFAQALDNLLAVVTEAGGTPESIVQLRVYVVDKREYSACLPEIGTLWRERMGRHYPAMALVQVADLLEEGAKVEIEGMAVL